MVVGSLLLAQAFSSAGLVGELFAHGLTWVAVGAAVLAVPPAAALALLARRTRAGSVVATLYGVLVVGLTAGHVREDTALLVAHLAGVALVLCAFPLDDPLDSAA